MVFGLEGIFPPHITPFTRQGDVDSEALRILVNFWIGSGVSGLVPCGSNGEAPYLSPEERRHVIEVVVDEVNGRVPVIAGTGSISTQETIRLTKDAEDLGAQAALVVSPFYFKPSDDELYEHYKSILESVSLPIVIYNVPKFTGYSINPHVIHRLDQEFDHMIGVKDSSGNISQIAEIIRLDGGRISVLAGTGDTMLATLMLGGNGAIAAIVNVAPRLCVSLYEAFKKGDYAEAGEIQMRLSQLNDVLVRKHNQIAAIKEALALLGKPSGSPRKPTLPLKEESRKDVKRVLRDLGLLS
jgi:4-hydroxy-tetrahydrodipicolinate synthase